LTFSFVYLNFNSGVDVSSLFLAAPEDVKQVAQQLATSGVVLKERALKAAEECVVKTSSRLREAMEAAGVPEDTIEEQLRQQRAADPTYVTPGFAPGREGGDGVRPPRRLRGAGGGGCRGHLQRGGGSLYI